MTIRGSGRKRVLACTALAALLCGLWICADAGASVGYYETHQEHVSGVPLGALSCLAGTTTCIAGDADGELFYTTEASAAETATWVPWAGPGVSPAQALACPSTTLCVIAAGVVPGGGGNVYRAHALGGSFLTAFTPRNGVNAISCPTESFCVASESGEGAIRWTAKPSGASWSAEFIGEGAMTGVSCLSASFCAVVDDSGDLHVAVTEAAVKKNSEWVTTDVGGAALRGISCVSTSRCLAVDDDGTVIGLAIALDGSASVSSQPVPGAESLDEVSCLGSTCAAGGKEGGVFSSTDAGVTWHRRFDGDGAVGSVSCLSASLCAAGTAGGSAITFNPATNVPPLELTTASLPAGAATAPYVASVAAQGGEPTYAWSATGLPPGLSIDATSGQISGTPSTAVCGGSPCPQPPATYTPTVTVSDENGTEASRSLAIALAGTDVSLRVATAGDGRGEVSSSPGGIDRCGAASGACESSYEDTTAVILTATPAAGSTFEGWLGGGCSGSGTCRVDLSEDTTVTASFRQVPIPAELLPPQTKIEKASISAGRATFRFTATEGATRFQCALVRRGKKDASFKGCSSPRTFRHLKPGRYAFMVRGIGPGGVDPTPAKRAFRMNG